MPSKQVVNRELWCLKKRKTLHTHFSKQRAGNCHSLTLCSFSTHWTEGLGMGWDTCTCGFLMYTNQLPVFFQLCVLQPVTCLLASVWFSVCSCQVFVTSTWWFFEHSSLHLISFHLCVSCSLQTLPLSLLFLCYERCVTITVSEPSIPVLCETHPCTVYLYSVSDACLESEGHNTGVHHQKKTSPLGGCSGIDQVTF